MILGIGSDIVDIRRIEKMLDDHGSRFEDRIFTAHEQRTAQSRQKAGAQIVAASYAKRFAAKEACAKALGTGMQSGISWQDMEITNQENGAPTLQLTGVALARLQAMTPPQHRSTVHVSLSDDYPYAQAYVILSSEPI